MESNTREPSEVKNQVSDLNLTQLNETTGMRRDNESIDDFEHLEPESSPVKENAEQKTEVEVKSVTDQLPVKVEDYSVFENSSEKQSVSELSSLATKEPAAQEVKSSASLLEADLLGENVSDISDNLGIKDHHDLLSSEPVVDTKQEFQLPPAKESAHLFDLDSQGFIDSEKNISKTFMDTEKNDKPEIISTQFEAPDKFSGAEEFLNFESRANKLPEEPASLPPTEGISILPPKNKEEPSPGHKEEQSELHKDFDLTYGNKTKENVVEEKEPSKPIDVPEPEEDEESVEVSESKFFNADEELQVKTSAPAEPPVKLTASDLDIKPKAASSSSIVQPSAPLAPSAPPAPSAPVTPPQSKPQQLPAVQSSEIEDIKPIQVFQSLGLDAWFKPDRLHPKVVELVYWRDPKKSGIVFGSVLGVLLSLSYFSLISVVAYLSLGLLSGTISFRIYKNVLQAVQKTSDGHPFKEILELDLTLPQDKVREVTDIAVAHVNAAALELRRLFLVEDLVDSIKFGVLLWCLTYVGSWFNGMTLIIIAFVALFTLPKVYENNKAQIDQNLDIVRSKINDITSKVKAAIPIGKKAVEEEKKEQ